MRNSRRLIVAFIMAALMSSAALKADIGAPGGAQKGTCGFLQGIIYKVGNANAAAVLTALFESLFDCDF
jgi:hypothetical protein